MVTAAWSNMGWSNVVIIMTIMNGYSWSNKVIIMTIIILMVTVGLMSL